MTEFRLVPASDDLNSAKSNPGWNCAEGPPLKLSLFGNPSMRKIALPPRSPSDRSGVVTGRILLAIQRNAGHKLQKVEIVSAVDGHVLDLLGSRSLSYLWKRRTFRARVLLNQPRPLWLREPTCMLISNASVRFSVTSMFLNTSD